RAFREVALWLRWKLRIATELDDQLDAIQAIDREHSENAEINYQHRPIKRIQLIKRTDVRRGLVVEFTEGVAGNIYTKISCKRDRAEPAVFNTLSWNNGRCEHRLHLLDSLKLSLGCVRSKTNRARILT